MSRLLISEPPLQVLRSLAVRVGLNEAIVLQQLHYLGARDPERWVRKSAGDLVAVFPFWAERTIRRTLVNLTTTGVLEARTVPTEAGRVNEYRVNLGALGVRPDSADGSGQSDRTPLLKGGREGTTDLPPTPAKRGRSILTPAQEPIGFSEWIGYHAEKANRSVPRAGTSARSELARTFAAIAAEGYDVEDFKLATDGVLADPFMVEQGHTKPDNVLRKSKIAGRIDDGRRAREGVSLSDKYARFEQ